MFSTRYSRRTFLAQSAAAMATPLWLRQQKAKPQKVAIIGAGISGLACARVLTKLGYEVVVFEAASRIGGRLYTDQSFGYPVELGSAWTLASGRDAVVAADMTQQKMSLIPDTMNWMIQGDDGKAVSAAGVTDATEKAKRAIESAHKEGLKLGAKATVRTALMSISNPILNDPPGRFALSVATDGVTGSGLDDLAAWWDPSHISGKQAAPATSWADYCTKLADGLDIRFQEAVSNVIFDKNGVQIDLDSSTVAVDKAVICVPLPVLRSRDFTLTGDVPTDWTTAIGKYGIGTLERVVLEFDKVRWPRLTRLADVTEVGSPCLYFEPLAGDKDHPILVGVIGGEVTLGDDVNIQATTQLRSILGGDLPDPVRSKVSRWSNNPFAMGGTVYPSPATTDDAVKTAFKPFGNRIFFAGDWASTEAMGTVHGAYMSGIQAAGLVSQE